MTVTSRMLQTDNDIIAMQRAIQQWIAEAGDRGYVHPGDIPHRIFNGLRRFDPKTLLQLWEDNNGLQGWGLVYPNWQVIEVFVAPEHRGKPLESMIFDWAETRLIEWMDKNNVEKRHIAIDVWSGDKYREALSAERDYTFKKDFLSITQRTLEDVSDLPSVDLPVGFSIRHAEGLHEAQLLADVHSGSFDSEWTLDQYQRVMQSPGYHHENEWVVVTSEGRFVAFCIIWLDEVNKVGLFEPVGTHKDFWRRGLARNLMIYMMRKLREKGITVAQVGHELDNPASTNLYASLGFHPKYTLKNNVKAL